VHFEPVIPTTDERELLLRYLHRQRQEVVATSTGLTEAQARWTPDGRLLPIIGVINHLTNVEWRWVDGRYLRLPFPARTDEFHPPDGASLNQVVTAYWDRERRTEEVVRSAPDLAAPCLGSEGDLRWVLLHLIEETAHHAGHADATRELIDGTRTRA